MAMENNIEKIISEETIRDENGNEFNKVTKEISIPRKTYLKGTISGKYRGNKLLNLEDENEMLFDFEIYEAEVICKSKEDFRKNRTYKFPKDFINSIHSKTIKGIEFPKDKLPETLQVTLVIDQKSFGINIIEPKLYEFKNIRRLHQTDGDEVYGTFNAFISGYIFDYEKKIVIENIPIYINPDVEDVIELPCESNGIKTGNERKNGSIVQKEYHCKHHNDTVWSNDKTISTPPGTPPGRGCLEGVLSLIAAIIGLIFLFFLIPNLIYFVGFYIVTLLLGWLAPYLKWIFRIIGIVFLFGFFVALINAFTHRSHSYNPSPVIVDNREKIEPVKTTNNLKDEWVVRFRKWQDYDGTIFQGKYKIKLSDIEAAHSNKNSLNIGQNSIKNYDQIVFNLKDFDKNKLNHVYTLFDSIGKVNKLNKIKFAEMIVSFVQDIPYTIVLEDGCDASFYNDQFTKNYLLNHQGECDGNQRFGINTPIEFLYSLKGDCDTRTLLIYTILSHYNYDVALMSSEFYGHSIIGVDLPIEGTDFLYNNQRYVLWETTTPNSKPGELSNNISNLNNWRISLKSK